MRPYLLFSLLAITLMTSCLGPQEQPVTKEDALMMARNIDSAIVKENDDRYLEFIQLDVFMNRIKEVSKKELPSSYKKGLKSGLKNANLGGQIIQSVKNENGTYQLVKHYEKDKVQHLLYRLYSDGGFNYHDYELTKVGGKVYIADIFIYLTGENFSKSVSELLASLQGAYTDLKREDVEMFRRLKKLMNENRAQEAKKLYDQLPASLREKKIMHINYLMIASGLSEEEYLLALNDFESRFSNEPYMFLSLIDAYTMRKDYNKVLEIINKLDSIIDKDPQLDYTRALVYRVMEKQAESRQALENLYKNCPQFQAGVIELIHNYMAAGEKEKATQIIKSYQQNEKFDQEVLELNLLQYPDLLKESSQ